MAAAEEDRGPARLRLPASPGPPLGDVHLLPCQVRHDGAAAVRRYFEPAIRPSPTATDRGAPDESSVSFRGRHLKGTRASVPEGYVGLVLEEDRVPTEERQLQVKGTFQSLMVWNLERAPNGTDEILLALGWPKIAEGIHAPVAE